MSWSETTLKIWMRFLISEEEKIVRVRMDPRNDFRIELIEAGGIRWTMVLNYECSLRPICEESEWRISGPIFVLAQYDSRGSNLWKFDAEIQHTVDIETEVPYRSQRVFEKKLDWKTKFDISHILSLESIEEMRRGISSDELGAKKYNGSTTLQIKIRVENNPSKTIHTRTLSLLEDTEGFSDIEFELENGAKLHGNKEILSQCSTFFEKHFNEDLNCSIMKLENIALEDFHGFLRMIFPNCDQDFDENRILAIMQLGVTYQAHCVMLGCEEFLIKSKKDYSEEDLEQFFQLADDHNLNQLQSWCFETMNEKQNAILAEQQLAKSIIGSRKRRGGV